MKDNLRLILNIIIPISIIIFVFAALPRIILFFMPFVIGAIVAWIANPMVQWINKKFKRINREHASLFIITLILCLIGFGIYALGFQLVQLTTEIAKHIPEWYNVIVKAINNLMEDNQEILNYFGIQGHLSSENLEKILSEFGETIKVLISNLSKKVASVSIGAVKSISSLIIYLVITIFSAYSFCQNREEYSKNISTVIPQDIIKYYQFLKNDLHRIFNGWLRAQFELMFMVFAVLAIGFLFLKVKYSILIAVITAFLDFLPLLGVGFVMWPWIAIDILLGYFKEAGGLIIIYLATQIVRNFMQPKILGDRVGLSPFLTIISMYLGFKLYSFTGLIFAVPVGMLFVSLYKYGAFDKMFSSIKELYRRLVNFL